VEELAQELLADGEFQALRLGGWLGTPETELFARAVEMASPPFYRADVELLVAALRLAAKLQQRDARLAGRVAIGAIALVVLLGFAGSGGAKA
jgi:hypothetical protein